MANDGWLARLWENAQIDTDPMERVRLARERGVEPVLVTGLDVSGDSIAVAWHIPDTNELVFEGFRVGDA